MSRQQETADRATRSLEILRDQLCDGAGKWIGGRSAFCEGLGRLLELPESGEKYISLLERLNAIQLVRVGEQERSLHVLPGSFGQKPRILFCLTLLRPNARVVVNRGYFELVED